MPNLSHAFPNDLLTAHKLPALAVSPPLTHSLSLSFSCKEFELLATMLRPLSQRFHALSLSDSFSAWPLSTDSVRRGRQFPSHQIIMHKYVRVYVGGSVSVCKCLCVRAANCTAC